MMSIADYQSYKQLVHERAPHVIHTEDDYEKYLKEIEQLMLRDRTAAEDELYQLLCLLVEQYEREHYQVFPVASPSEILRELMLANNTPQSALAELLGSKGLASMALSGKRAISKKQAKQLGDFFHIDPKIFIEL